MEDKRESCLHRFLRVLRRNLLIVLLATALCAGVGLGLGLRSVWSPYEKEKIFYLNFPGQLLMGMLNMLVLPLIVSSLITALSTMDNSMRGKLGLASVLYTVTSTMLAVTLGIVLVMTIQPGYRSTSITRTGVAKQTSWLPSLLDLFRSCFPENIVEATFQRLETVLTMTNFSINNNTEVITRPVPKLVVRDGTNVLGVLAFSVALGSVISYMGPEGKPLRDFFQCLFTATMVLVRLVIWFSPVGILFLIAARFVSMEEDPTVVAIQLGFYFITVLSGLFIHGLIVLPLVYFIATRKNPYKFMQKCLKALCTAWGTSSSSAALPLTLECLEFNCRVQPQIARFQATVGSTINMNGTALYEAVAVIFIAQVNQVPLSIADIIVVSLTATAAAIGTPPVPQAGLVTMTIVLASIGLPEEEIRLVLAVDWLVNRFRATVNVLDDCIGSGVLGHIFRNSIKAEDALAANLEGTWEVEKPETVPNGNLPSLFPVQRADDEAVTQL